MSLIMKSTSMPTVASRTSTKVQASLRPAVRAAPKAVAPARANQMMVWQPVNNK